VTVFYAALKIGAVIIPVFSGFGAHALATRLQDGAGRIVFTADGSLRRGKPFAIKPEVDHAIEEYPGIEKVVVVDRLGAAGARASSAPRPGRDVWWDDFLDSHAECPASLEAETAHHPLTSEAPGVPGTVTTPAPLRRWPGARLRVRRQTR
jgi:acetyl-CoA synthetase